LSRQLSPFVHHISISLSREDSVCPFPFSLAASKGITDLFSFPAGTKMFQFPAYTFLSELTRFAFGDSGFKGCMLLAQTYRSLPRPSSLFKPSYPSDSLIE
jgi:hypothetical protein